MRIVPWVAASTAAALLVVAMGQSAHAVGNSDWPQGSGIEVAGHGIAAPELTGLHGMVAPKLSPRGDVALPKAPKWWTFRALDRKPLSVSSLVKGPRAGQRVLQLVIGKTYQVHGRLPARQREALAGKQLTIEAKRDAGGAWKSIARFASDTDGRFTATIRIPTKLQGVHRYHIRATGAARSARSGTALPSDTLTAAGDVAFSVTITNDTKTDLLLSFPTSQNPVTGTYSNAVIAVPEGVSQLLTYVNPVEGVTTFGFTANRLECFFGCSTYYANWDHAPNRKHTPCSTAMPSFDSGSEHTVRLTPQLGSSGFDMFVLDTNGSEICTGGLDTKLSQWFSNHPVAKWATIVVAVAAAVTIVVLAWEAIAAAFDVVDTTSEIRVFSESVIQGDDFWDLERYPLVFADPIP